MNWNELLAKTGTNGPGPWLADRAWGLEAEGLGNQRAGAELARIAEDTPAGRHRGLPALVPDTT